MVKLLQNCDGLAFQEILRIKICLTDLTTVPEKKSAITLRLSRNQDLSRTGVLK